MFTYSVWMPCARKWELQERAKAEAARSRGKAYAIKPYKHVKGKLIATMASDTHKALLRDSLADLDARPPLPAERNCFTGREWVTAREYRRARAVARLHARWIRQCEEAEAEAAPTPEGEAIAA